MTVAEIKETLEQASMEELDKVIALFVEDERASVKKLLETYQKKKINYLAEVARIEQMRTYENKYPNAEYICGIDEVGRGPLAGPVVTCAIILPKDCKILYVNDSKKLSEKKREELFDIISEQALDISIGIESPQTIDEINILQATYRAMQKSIHGLKHKPDIILADAVTIPDIPYPQEAIIKGDAKSISIAAASIIAKVTRDRMMREFDEIYSGYDFASNKGYGSEKHMAALKQLGPSPIHRQSFIGKILEEKD